MSPRMTSNSNMWLRTVTTISLCNAVLTYSGIYTINIHSQVGIDGKTCEDNLQLMEGLSNNQSIHSARLEEKLECKDRDILFEREICEVKLNAEGKINTTADKSLEERITFLENENKRLYELFNSSNTDMKINFTQGLRSVTDYSIADCGDTLGVTVLDVINKRYFTPSISLSFWSPQMNRSRAKKFCENCGMKLASFETQEEYDEFDNSMRNQGGRAFRERGYMFTSAVRIKNDTHDIFVWEDSGIPVTLNNYTYVPDEIVDSNVNTLLLKINYHILYGSGSCECPNGYNHTYLLTYFNEAESTDAFPLCERN